MTCHVTDGTFSYESEDFDPIPLDLYTAASLGEIDIVQDILDRLKNLFGLELENDLSLLI